jgi:hypothetical protein
MAVLAVAAPQTSELDRAIEMLERLDSIPYTTEYRDERLDEVISDFNAHLPMPLRADWQSMERLGVSPDDRVTLRLNPTVASSVLAALVMTLGDEFERPVIEVHAGQIVLTTLQGTAAMRITATYDVRDLLANAPLMQQLRDELPSNEPVAASQPASSGQAEPADPAPKAAPPEPPQRLLGRNRPAENPMLQPPKLDDSVGEMPAPLTPGERLYMLISDHVDPEAWMNFGGDRARVSDANGVLMVTATPSVHRSFRDALAALRRANPTSITVDAKVVDLPRAVYEQLVRQNSTSSASLAAAIEHANSATLLWQTSAGVALNAHLDVDSSDADVHVHMAIAPTLNAEAGVLNIAVDASTQQGQDRRAVKTSVTIAGDQGAAVTELPPAKRSDTIRVLVLVPQRS